MSFYLLPKFIVTYQSTYIIKKRHYFAIYKFIRTWLKCKVYISIPSVLTSTMLMEILLHLCHFCLYICICIRNSHYSMFLMCSSRQIYIKCIIDWIVECLQFYSKSELLARSIDTGTISSVFLKQLKLG